MNNLLIQGIRWIPFLFFLPFLYLLGWILVQPLYLLPVTFEVSDISLLGTICTFILFLVSLPNWIKIRWKKKEPWHELGLIQSATRAWIKDFVRGFSFALFLILVLLIFFSIGSWITWVGEFSLNNILNAILLTFGVGFAEELIFRGWLWGEIKFLIGARWSLYIQAAIFSAAHIRFELGFFEQASLLLGLFFLGLLLGLRRIIDKGSLVGCIGLHGGLVGTWFLINSGLINLSSTAPSWLAGPGDATPNPIGGIVAICSISLILWHQRMAFAIGGFPCNGERKA